MRNITCIVFEAQIAGDRQGTVKPYKVPARRESLESLVPGFQERTDTTKQLTLVIKLRATTSPTSPFTTRQGFYCPSMTLLGYVHTPQILPHSLPRQAIDAYWCHRPFLDRSRLLGQLLNLVDDMTSPSRDNALVATKLLAMPDVARFHLVGHPSTAPITMEPITPEEAAIPPSGHPSPTLSSTESQPTATTTTDVKLPTGNLSREPAAPYIPPRLTASISRAARDAEARARTKRDVIRDMRKYVKPMKPTYREPSSLLDIMQQDCGKSLFVLPMCWTDDHTKLLKVRFVDVEPVLRPVPDFDSPKRAKYPPRPSMMATALTRELTELLNPSRAQPWLKLRAIKAVMGFFYPTTMSMPKSGMDLDLYFGGRKYRRALRIPVLWDRVDGIASSFDSAATRPASQYGQIPSGGEESGFDIESQSSHLSGNNSQSTLDVPMLAYVNRSQLALIRANLFRICPGPENDLRNTPIFNLQRLRGKRLIPANLDHDAYLVGILLAMAQAHFYPSAPKTEERPNIGRCGGQKHCKLPKFKDVTVKLLTHTDEPAEFIVYTAVMTAVFLEKFNSPEKAPMVQPGSDSGIDIKITKVPVWPLLGLQERLGKALGREITGRDFLDTEDEESIETWETEQERILRLGSTKRKREAPPEDLNQGSDVTDSPCSTEAIASNDVVEDGLSIPVDSPPLSPPPLSPSSSKRRRTESNNESGPDPEKKLPEAGV